MRIRFTDRAVDDLSGARRHYDSIDPALGESFLLAVDAALELVEMFPRAAPLVVDASATRRARLRRFPYGVVYTLRDEEDEAWVVRILHAKRDLEAALADEGG